MLPQLRRRAHTAVASALAGRGTSHSRGSLSLARHLAVDGCLPACACGGLLWSEQLPDLRVKVIADLIERPRYLAIMANLSFMTSNECVSDSDSLRKMGHVDDALRESARAAITLGTEVKGVTDEGRVAILSSRCPLITT